MSEHWGLGQVLRAAGGSTGQTSSSADWASISQRVTAKRHPVEPVTFDSVGAPIYRHQLPPEEPSDER